MHFFYLKSLYAFSSLQSFAAFVASKRDDHQEEGSTSWRCCSQTFKEHSAIHKHVARTHDAETQQLTQAAYEHLLSQLEEESESQQPNEREAEPADISAWIPETGHISEEQLQKYCSNYDSFFWDLFSTAQLISLWCPCLLTEL